MKKLFFFSLLTVLFSANGFSQTYLKLRYPKCELINKSALTQENKTFMIKTKSEFEQYFKITDGTTIDFDMNVALVAFTGADNADKFIQINAASFVPSNRKLNIRYDYVDKEDNISGKFCVAVIHKMDFKKIQFLKGTAYTIRQNYRE